MTTTNPRGDAPTSIQEFERAWLVELGLRPLSRHWAKAEILIGLSAAVVGLQFLAGAGLTMWGGGLLVVFGLYLAMAGHRSHLYQAMNRQNAALAALIRELGSGQRVSP